MTVALGFDRRCVQPAAGFGFLVPRSEGKRMLAALLFTINFRIALPRTVPAALLSGGSDEQVLQLSDENILGIVRDEPFGKLARQAIRSSFGIFAAGKVRWCICWLFGPCDGSMSR